MSGILKKPAAFGKLAAAPANSPQKRPAASSSVTSPFKKPACGPSEKLPESLQTLTAYIVNLERRKDRWKRVSSMLQKEVPWLKFEQLKASDGAQNPIPASEVAETWNTGRNAHYGDYFEWVVDAPGTDEDKRFWRWACEVPGDDDKEWRFKEDNSEGFLYIRDAPSYEKGPVRTASAKNLSTGKTLRLKLQFQQRQLVPGENLKMSGGERGCAHSHLRLWKLAAERSDNTLVLEDDVHLTFYRTGGKGKMNGKIFTKRLALALKEAPSDFDIIYLGWSGWRGGHHKLWSSSDHSEDESTKSIVRRAEYVWTTVAYVISQAGARKLLAVAQPLDQPVDNFMAWEASQGNLKSFVALDEGDDDNCWSGGIVDQLDFQGDSDIPKSDGGVQGDDAKDFAVEPNVVP